MLKKLDIKYFFLIVIVLGSLFTILPCFHANLWFDEAYSVGITEHNFQEIWTIGANDVHPVLYYFLLHIVSIAFNGNIVMLRLFSCIPLIILAILGYTHIRKDFGNRVGLIFSFLALFMPVCLEYSGEIRMYTWSMLFVTIMSIYAYRIYKNGSTKNIIVFSIFSLLSAYTHYYALVTSFVENAILFIYLVYKFIKNKEKNDLFKFIICAIIQVILYLPWIGAFLSQANSVSKGFWIGEPNIFDILVFQFTGNLGEPAVLNNNIAMIFTLIGFIIIISMLTKHIKKSNAVKFSLIVYILIVAILWIVSIFAQPILYPRYFLNLTGIFLFVLAFSISKMNNKMIIASWATITIVSCIVNINLINENYDVSNSEPFEYINSKIQPDDILVFNNQGAGFIVTTKMNFKESYFYDQEHWGVEKAYKAFHMNDTIQTLDKFQHYKGRIWVVTSGKEDLSKELKEKMEYGKTVDIKTFKTKYHNYEYRIELIENI